MRRRGRRILYRRPRDMDRISPELEDNTFSFDLYKNLGRSHICIIREYYLDLFSISRDRNTNDVYSTALHIAAAKNKHSHEVEEVLVNSSERDKNARNRFGETAMLLALKENVNENVINLLLKYGCDCIDSCFRGITPLHVAAYNNKIDLMLNLIEKGADVNAASNIGITPLHLAVLASQYEAVRELLNHNANPKLVTVLEFTPLMLALGFQDVDIRICDMLYTYDILATTRIGNPVYCALKSQSLFAEKLILDGADVSCIGHLYDIKVSCLLEVISQNKKYFFDLIWPRFNQEVFKSDFSDFLEYVADSCGFKGSDLVDCLCTILSSIYGINLVKHYYKARKCSFLQIFFEDLEHYQLTSNDCCQIIMSLPIVFYDDISYVYRKFNFDKELVNLLKSYEYGETLKQSTYSNIYIDYLYYNSAKTDIYNLKEISQFLKFHTPNNRFRSHFYSTFSGLSYSRDTKLNRLILLYKLCDQMLAKRPIASLRELTRNKLRYMMFSTKKKPYKALSELPIPEAFKDILFLKKPIYCDD